MTLFLSAPTQSHQSSLFFPAPSVYICSALSSFDNDPVMGLSKSKVAIVCGLSVSIDHSAVEKPFAYHGLPFVERWSMRICQRTDILSICAYNSVFSTCAVNVLSWGQINSVTVERILIQTVCTKKLTKKGTRLFSWYWAYYCQATENTIMTYSSLLKGKVQPPNQKYIFSLLHVLPSVHPVCFDVGCWAPAISAVEIPAFS